jgi:hypothetical protein
MILNWKSLDQDMASDVPHHVFIAYSRDVYHVPPAFPALIATMMGGGAQEPLPLPLDALAAGGCAGFASTTYRAEIHGSSV